MICYHSRWVLPISSPPLENGTVAEENGRIVYVGPRNKAPGGESHDLGDAILLPGLVNAHTHLELTVMRGLLEDLDFHEWIARLHLSREDVLTPEMLQDAARWGVSEGLLLGTTTFADPSASPAAAQAMSEAGVRGIVYQEVFGPDPARCEAMVANLRNRLVELRAYASPLLWLGVSPHAPYTVSDALFVEAARYADSEELPLAVHVAESAAESELVREASGPFADSLRARGIAVRPRGRSPVALLERTGVLGPRTLLIHCVRLDDEDIATVGRSGCAVVHCPVSNAKLGHGIAPVLELLASGVRVALGTDSVASNNRMDMLEEARTAALLQRARTRRASALGARAALEMATLGGAKALGLASRIGSLEAGKDADLTAFPLAGAVPAGDPESAAVFSLYGRTAVLTAVAGRALVMDGRPVQQDPALRDRVEAAGVALANWHLEAAPAY